MLHTALLYIYTDGVLSLPTQLEASENSGNGGLEVCTSLSSGGVLETSFVVTLMTVDNSAGETFCTSFVCVYTPGSLHTQNHCLPTIRVFWEFTIQLILTAIYGILWILLWQLVVEACIHMSGK